MNCRIIDCPSGLCSWPYLITIRQASERKLKDLKCPVSSWGWGLEPTFCPGSVQLLTLTLSAHLLITRWLRLFTHQVGLGDSSYPHIHVLPSPSSHRHGGLLLLIRSLFIYLETRSHVSQADLKLLTSQMMGAQMCIAMTCSSLLLKYQMAVDHYTQIVQCAPGSHWLLWQA